MVIGYTWNPDQVDKGSMTWVPYRDPDSPQGNNLATHSNGRRRTEMMRLLGFTLQTYGKVNHPRFWYTASILALPRQSQTLPLELEKDIVQDNTHSHTYLRISDRSMVWVRGQRTTGYFDF